MKHLLYIRGADKARYHVGPYIGPALASYPSRKLAKAKGRSNIGLAPSITLLYSTVYELTSSQLDEISTWESFGMFMGPQIMANELAT
jgi:hypothetical protein